MYQVVFLYLNILSIIEKLSTIENTLVEIFVRISNAASAELPPLIGPNLAPKLR